MDKVLILGAGMVAKPLVEYLLMNNISIIIASPMQQRGDEMIAGNSLGLSIDWSMDDKDTLARLINECDITVSLLPYIYHSEVAILCLKYRKSLVTTSYVQPAMQALDEDAKKAGVLFLNEIGLDPGIDHMSAMSIIDKIHEKGGKVEEFYSLCGALPAPEAANNPMGYKFTWSPKGVILASRNSALYLKDGQKVFIEPVNLFSDCFQHKFKENFNLEVYPNRDSISYSDIYNIPEVRTMYRGTFRFKGWCSTLNAMKKLNMLDDTIKDYTRATYAEFLAEKAGCDKKDLKYKIATRLGVAPDSDPINAFEFLGFFSDELIGYEASAFDITSDIMIKRMALGDNERDLVILQHIFLAAWPDGSKEVLRSSMTAYGTPATNTAIARTVSLPAAIAVKMILYKKIKLTGIHRPVIAEIYRPVLDELKTLGIEMKEEYGLPLSEKVKLN